MFSIKIEIRDFGLLPSDNSGFHYLELQCSKATDGTHMLGHVYK